jgi:hypothetical protein
MVGDRRSPCPALLRAAAVPVVDSSRPASTRPHPAAFPAASRTRPRCPVPRTPAGVPGRSAPPADITVTRLWTPAAAGPALRTPATAAGSCGHDGNAPLDSRQPRTTVGGERSASDCGRRQRGSKVRRDPATPYGSTARSAPRVGPHHSARGDLNPTPPLQTGSVRRPGRTQGRSRLPRPVGPLSLPPARSA